MNVSQAMQARKSIRNFLSTPVADELIGELLTKAARAASGGNLQPWRVYVINGATMPRFLQYVQSRTEPETPAYPIYPANLKEPYRSYRYKVGEDMYALLGVPREDKAARLAHLARNFCFFDAPAAFFCFVDRIMGPPQWSDLGMFLQSFMLLAKEAGLDTCPQEAWSNKAETVSTFLDVPGELMLFCGMAIGEANPAAPVNQLVTERAPLEDWTTFVK
ncbi:MAG: nitroreductase [Gammaproteobacteria bacterium]|nr:nitroreductase [Gammaproteobacteria bacterium]